MSFFPLWNFCLTIHYNIMNDRLQSNFYCSIGLQLFRNTSHRRLLFKNKHSNVHYTSLIQQEIIMTFKFWKRSHLSCNKSPRKKENALRRRQPERPATCRVGWCILFFLILCAFHKYGLSPMNLYPCLREMYSLKRFLNGLPLCPM